jgi:hypothetical protein
MLRHPLRALFATLAVFATAGLAHASDSVRRCVGSAGEPVFTDRSCAALSLPDPGHDTAPAALSERGTCATSPEQLRDRVARAFARQDAIALSGLYLWQGYGATAAVSGLRELAARVHEPLLELRIEPASRVGRAVSWDSETGNVPAPAMSGNATFELHVTTSSGARNAITNELRIALVERAGCWWLERP